MIQFNISYPKFNSTIIQFKINSGDSIQKIIHFITLPKKEKRKGFLSKIGDLDSINDSFINFMKKLIQDYSIFSGR